VGGGGAPQGPVDPQVGVRERYTQPTPPGPMGTVPGTQRFAMAPDMRELINNRVQPGGRLFVGEQVAELMRILMNLAAAIPGLEDLDNQPADFTKRRLPPFDTNSFPIAEGPIAPGPRMMGQFTPQEMMAFQMMQQAR
jgi:hypothetical protein